MNPKLVQSNKRRDQGKGEGVKSDDRQWKIETESPNGLKWALPKGHR